MAGLYIHVPFCMRKCPYCDFYSVVCNDFQAKADAYCDAVIRNFAKYKGEKIDTVYFGGGTPSLLSPDLLKRLIYAAKDYFVLSENAEITVEMNPSSTDRGKLSGYKSAGVNRLSFGVQSSNDSELAELGRLHSFEQAKNVVNLAHECGFENISCDLMIGTPYQTEQTLLQSIDEICELDITHVSAYLMKIETGTGFDCDEIRAKICDDDSMSDMYIMAVNRLSEKGFNQYEVSNFSRVGFESRHNLKYWQQEPYIGIGPSAHSFYNGIRFACPDKLDEFISKPQQTILITDAAPNELDEYIMLGLRLKSGVTAERISELGGNSEAVLALGKLLERSKLAKVLDNTISLTEQGFLVSNLIIAEFLDNALL